MPRSITGDTALRLARFFGMAPQFWMNLQSLFDLRVAEQKSGQEIRMLPTVETVARPTQRASR